MKRRRRLALTDLNTGEILSPRVLWRVPRAPRRRTARRQSDDQHYVFLATFAVLGLWIAIASG